MQIAIQNTDAPTAGHNLPAYWFADPRALEIAGQVVASDGECVGQHSHYFHAKYASQQEPGVIFTGALVDELQEIRRAGLANIEEAIDWANSAHILYFRTQNIAVSDLLLVALEWRPNGGGSHDAGAAEFYEKLKAERAAA